MKDPKFNPDRLSEKFMWAIMNSRDERIMDTWSWDDQNEILSKGTFWAEIILRGSKDVMSGVSVPRAIEYLNLLSRKTEEDMKLSKIAWIALDELIGKDLVEAQAKAETRILHLLSLATNLSVDSNVSLYFQRIAHCYLYGFDEQELIMCRSVLEASFQEAIPDELCEKHPLPYKGKTRINYGLAGKIFAVRQEGLLKDLNCDKKNENLLCDQAEIIKDRANDILHSDRKPQEIVTEDEIFKYFAWTVKIVERLNSIM